MSNFSQIRLVFILTKNDGGDFDRDAVTQHLCIAPTNTAAPALSKGTLTCSADIGEIEKDLPGISIIPAASPPFRMLKHAFWSIESPKIECLDLGEPLRWLEQLLSGKEADILYICEKYNLSADLIVRVFAEANNMPELIISSSSVSFWAAIGVSIDFDFYLD